MTSTKHFGARSRTQVTILAALAAGACFAAPQTARAETPIAALVGTWSGTGQATFDSGKTETMRCKAYYTAKGADGLAIAIRCANASANIDLRATLAFADGAVSGDWEERTYNAAGSVAGKASANAVNLAITGGGLTAAMAVAITGSSHTVVISTQGSGLKGVNISVTRG